MDNTLRKMRKELTNLNESAAQSPDKACMIQNVFRYTKRLFNLLETLEKSQPVYVYRLRIDDHIDKYILVSTDNRGRYLSRTDADGRQRFFVDVKGVSSSTGGIPASINGELASRVIHKDTPVSKIYEMVDEGHRLSALYFVDKEMLKMVIRYANNQFISKKQQALAEATKVIANITYKSISALEEI